MIQLFMSRSGSSVIVPLNLPASHGAMAEAYSQLEQANRTGKTEIVEIKSEVLHQEKSYDELYYEADQIHFYVRKAAHMTEYFLLAIAVSFPLYVYRVRGFWLFLLAGIICVGFAGLDEYHQSFVSGRSPSVRDVCIDSSGALIGIILVQFFCWSTLHNPSGSHKKKKKTRKKRRR